MKIQAISIVTHVRSEALPYAMATVFVHRGDSCRMYPNISPASFARTQKAQIAIMQQGDSQGQKWFWFEGWQQKEREAQADIDAGRVALYDGVEETLAALEKEQS